MEFENHFGKGGTKLLNMKTADFSTIVEPLLLKMRDCQKEPGNLKECSSWMSEFKPEFLRTELEIPGKLCLGLTERRNNWYRKKILAEILWYSYSEGLIFC